MSRYDIEIAHGGNAQYALEEAKMLVGNHINSYGNRLDELGEEVRQLDMFGAPIVSEGFDASKLRDDDLETGLVTELEEDWDDSDDEPEL